MSATPPASFTTGLSSTNSSSTSLSRASALPASASRGAPSPVLSSASNPRRRHNRVPPASGKPGPFDAHRRLTSRDRLLLSWLAEHYLLSSVQIARALFTNPRTARLRLTILARLGFLTAIPSGRDDGAP